MLNILVGGGRGEFPARSVFLRLGRWMDLKYVEQTSMVVGNNHNVACDPECCTAVTSQVCVVFGVTVM